MIKSIWRKQLPTILVLDSGGSKFVVRLPTSKSRPKLIVFVLQESMQGTIWIYVEMFLGKAFILMWSWRTCITEAQELPSKIVFTNGSQDPWRHASKQQSSKDMPSYLIKCRNCGHGTDLRGCPQSPFRIEGDSSNCSSPAAVNTVRDQIAGHIDLWLSQCQISKNQQCQVMGLQQF